MSVTFLLYYQSSETGFECLQLEEDNRYKGPISVSPHFVMLKYTCTKAYIITVVEIIGKNVELSESYLPIGTMVVARPLGKEETILPAKDYLQLVRKNKTQATQFFGLLEQMKDVLATTSKRGSMVTLIQSETGSWGVPFLPYLKTNGEISQRGCCE
jgi:hypothetical protein